MTWIDIGDCMRFDGITDRKHILKKMVFLAKYDNGNS
jgi:hypothetical protein